MGSDIRIDNWSDFEKKYGPYSSLAIWADPTNNDWRNKGDKNISIVPVINDLESFKKLCNNNYIFVGLNPSSKPTNDDYWTSFHKAKSNDYILRFGLKHTEYWGSFLTDLLEVENSNSREVMKEISIEDRIAEGIEKLVDLRGMLGGEATVIAIGRDAYDQLYKSEKFDCIKEAGKLKKMMHFSNRCLDIDSYRAAILTQLGKHRVYDESEVERLRKFYSLNGGTEDLCSDYKDLNQEKTAHG